jgi:proline iminopeptidase
MELYPENKPFDSGYLQVGDGHALYYERQGNPKGKPVVYLHGGPGGGCSFGEYRMFNPDHFNVLMFDQRGSGKSTPYASTHANNTTALVSDIEKFRKHCDVKSWSVCGGSWGSALAMFYAEKHPQHVERMLLRGVFFADQDGANHITEGRALSHPMADPLFKEYSDLIPAEELKKDGLLTAYHKRVTSADETMAMEAARRFYVMDTALATYKVRQDWIDEANNDPQSTLALSRLWFHYAVHHFKPENKIFLLNAMNKLEVPVNIIHGTDDLLCPVMNAEALADSCHHVSLTTPLNCGHSQAEPALAAAFIDITERWMAEDKRIKPGNNLKPAGPA